MTSGSHQLREPVLQVLERRDVLEAPVGEGRAVPALGRGLPAELAVEAVVVVVQREAHEALVRGRRRGEDLAVEQLGLEDAPEALDLAVRPGRVDLGADVPDMELGKGPPEERQDARHPGREGAAVVAHDLVRQPAQLEAVAQPGQDGDGLRPGQDAQADEEAAVVVDEPDDPDLRVAPLRPLQPEGALDVDVPELVGPAPLVRRATLPVDARSCRALLREERGGFVEVDTSATLDWDAIRERIRQFGMRNSNCLAIAPTATIANIMRPPAPAKVATGPTLSMKKPMGRAEIGIMAQVIT